MATVAQDKKSVVLTLEDGARLVNFSTKNKVTVAKAVGLEKDYSVENVEVADSVFPTFESVSATGPREVTIVFSEPVTATNIADAVGSLSLDNGAISLDPTVANFIPGENKLVVNTYSDLSAGEHTLAVKTGSANKLVDFADAKVVPATKTFTYAKDATAPTVTVKSSTENTVTLKFNKSVTNVNKAAVLFSHTYKGQNQVNGTSVTPVAGTTDEYTVTFATAFPPGKSTVYVDYAPNTTDANKIKDNYGNVLAPTSFEVETVADTTKPEVSKVEFVNPTSVKVTFSETVLAGNGTNGAENAANYKLTEADGKTAIAVNNAVLDGTGKVVTLTTGTINGGNPILTVKNIKDRSIAGNVLDEVAKQFVATDKVPPTIVDLDKNTGGTQAQLLSAKKVKIAFSEAMDKASIENKANYLFGAAALDEKVKATAATDNKSVVLDFTEVAAGGQMTPANGTINVGRVADAAGNLIEAFSTSVLVPGSTSAPLFDKAEAINKNQVKLTFKEVITGLTASDLAVNPGTGTYEKVTAVNTTVADGKTTVIATIASDLPANATNVKVQTVANSTTDAVTQAVATNGQNEYGVKVNIAADTAVADKIAPSLVATNAIETLDLGANGKIDHIKVTFNEAVAAGSISLDKFTVAGYTVADAYAATAAPTTATDRTTAVVADSTTVYIRVVEKDTTDLDAKPTVTIGNGVTDVAGNAFVFKATDTTQSLAVNKVASFSGLGTLSGGATAQKGVYDITVGTANVTIDGKMFTYDSTGGGVTNWKNSSELATLVSADAALGAKYTAADNSGKLKLTQKVGQETATQPIVTGTVTSVDVTVAGVAGAKAALTFTVKAVPVDGVILNIGDKKVGFKAGGGVVATADFVIDTTVNNTATKVADAIEALTTGGNVVIKAGAVAGNATVEVQAAAAGVDGNALTVN